MMTALVSRRLQFVGAAAAGAAAVGAGAGAGAGGAVSGLKGLPSG